MGKITIKHYLNTNLKPYIIKGECYYSIYIMIVVNRKNTKVKSITFEELYTEKDFEEIICEDNDLLQQEITAIENLCLLVQDVIGAFDTSFFSAYYSSMQNMFVGDIEFELPNSHNDFSIWDKTRNSLSLSIDDFVFGSFSLSINRTHGMDMFTWFSGLGQNKLCEFLERNHLINNNMIEIINKLVFLGSMKIFGKILKDSKKGKELYDKYSEIIENDYWIYTDEIGEKYGISE